MVIALLVVVTALSGVLVRSAQSDPREDRIWYAPNPGSLDMLRMFERPEEWRQARNVIDVFQFTMQHTFATPDPIVGPNSYSALTRANAFRLLTEWGKKTALGVGSVKEHYCTSDDSGMDRAIADTLAAVAAIRRAGGRVHYLAMDEPFLSGTLPRCEGPLEQTADRLQRYMRAVRRAHPLTGIGLIEAYPSFAPDEFASMLRLTRERGVLPAFLQVDVDLNAVRPGRHDFPNDMKRLQAIAAEYRIPFGIIIWGHNGDVDSLFARDAKRLADAFREAFPTWASMPEQLSVQSWSESSSGLRITPANLPEDRPHTLTNILLHTHRRWVGEVPSDDRGWQARRR